MAGRRPRQRAARDARARRGSCGPRGRSCARPVPRDRPRRAGGRRRGPAAAAEAGRQHLVQYVLQQVCEPRSPPRPPAPERRARSGLRLETDPVSASSASRPTTSPVVIACNPPRPRVCEPCRRVRCTPDSPCKLADSARQAGVVHPHGPAADLNSPQFAQSRCLKRIDRANPGRPRTEATERR
jgi:hypothetical protein